MKKIVLGQVNPTVGDISGNALLLEQLLHDAHQKGAEVVVFPQFSLCGFGYWFKIVLLSPISAFSIGETGTIEALLHEIKPIAGCNTNTD